jgi:signal transduction histidine kinase
VTARAWLLSARAPLRQSRASLRRSRAAGAAWYAFTALYGAFVLGWLLLGLATALTAHASGVHGWALAAAAGQHGPAWKPVGRGLLAGARESYPPVDVVFDYIFSAVNLLFAAILFWLGRHDWTVRCLVIGMVGSAGAFNLQAHTSVAALTAMTGVNIDWWHVALLHGVGGVAYVFALLLFPTGSLDWGGRRHWPVRLLLATSIVGAAALLSVSTAEAPHTISFVLFFGLLTPVAGVTAQLVRYRRATTADARQQSRVLLWALGLSFAAALLLTAVTLTVPGHVPGMTASMPGLKSDIPFLERLSSPVVFWVFRAVFTMIPFAIMAGVLRFRLWDVERVFNRTLIYGVLIAMIGAVYVFGVVQIERALGLSTSSASPLQLLAAALIAFGFQPARARVGRLADRVVYGKRKPAYDVLAEVPALGRASEPGAAALGSLARIVAEGLAAGSASVALDLPDGTSSTYRWPAGDGALDPAGEWRIPVSYRGEHVGALCLPAGAERRLAPDRRALLGDLAGSVGVILHNASLSIQLEHSLDDIEARSAQTRASRWRIVTAQDSERRKLERDLHDGAQPSLTAVRLTLGLASHRSQSGDAVAARRALGQLQGQITDALARLHQTLRGLDPQIVSLRALAAALADLAALLGAQPVFRIAAGEGLPGGAESQPDGEEGQPDGEKGQPDGEKGQPDGEKGQPDGEEGQPGGAESQPGGDVALDPAVGATVYFCCAEALQNTVKHCPGALVEIRVDTDADAQRLGFTVLDQGPGFDTATAPPGGGLQNMADRTGAIGGGLTISSEPGQGTRVTGWVPLALAAPVLAGDSPTA